MALTDVQIRRIYGARIRQARISAELSGYEVARRLGISPQAFYGWENGHGSPTDGRRLELAKVLGVDHRELFGLDGELDGEVA